MKVALVIERMEAWRGGAETSTQQYALALQAAGCDVHVITASRGQPHDGMALHMLPSGPLGRAWATRAFVRQARDLALAEGFDVVHAVAPMPGANLYQPRGGTIRETVARNVALCRPEKRWLKRVGNLFNAKQQLQLRLERQMLTGRPAPVVVAISDYVTTQLQTHYGLPAERVRKVFNAVDTRVLTAGDRAANRRDVRALYHLADDEVVLLCVAHNFKLKGVGSLVEALGQVAQRQPAVRWKLLVIGRDNPIPHLANAERLGIADRVQFVGSTERIAAFYHASDVLVHPTYYDPCSRVVLEALAAGLPAITTRTNGAHEVMTDGQHGVVISDGAAVGELADAVTRLLDPEFRRRCAAATSGLVERVDMTRHVREMLAVYQDIVAHGPSVADVCRGLGYRVPAPGLGRPAAAAAGSRP